MECIRQVARRILVAAGVGVLLVTAAGHALGQIQPPFFAPTGEFTYADGQYGIDLPLENPAQVYPAAKIGALGHPTSMAWGWSETCQASNGNPTDECYNWSHLDAEFAAAETLAKQTGGTPTVVIALGGLTPSWAVNSTYQSNSTYCAQHSDPGMSVNVCNLPPDDIDNGAGNWLNFVDAVIQRYGPNAVGLPSGTSYANVVKYYDTWNEANNAGGGGALGFWYLANCYSTATECKFVTTLNPSGYEISDMGQKYLGELQKILYNQMHNSSTGDPNAQVLTPSAVGAVTGGVPKEVDAWIADDLASLYTNYGTSCSGSSICADGISFHGYIHAGAPHPMPEMTYDLTNPGTDQGTTCKSSSDLCYGPLGGTSNGYGSLIDNVRTAANNNHASGLPLFDTEFSWGSPDFYSGNSSQYCNASGETNCDTAYLARAYIIQASYQATDNLQLASWYEWGPQLTADPNDCSTNPNDCEADGALLDQNGNVTNAAVAFSWLTNWLDGATISTPCAATGSGFWICYVTWDNGSVAARIIWWLNDDGNTHNWTAGSSFTCYQVVDNSPDPNSSTAHINTIVNHTVPVDIRPVILLEPGSQNCPTH